MTSGNWQPGFAQARAQAVQLVAIAICARSITTQWLTDLRSAGRAQHGALGAMKFEAGRIERQPAEVQQCPDNGFRFGNQFLVLKVEHTSWKPL